jgi:hypothetical protein
MPAFNLIQQPVRQVVENAVQQPLRNAPADAQ